MPPRLGALGVTSPQAELGIAGGKSLQKTRDAQPTCDQTSASHFALAQERFSG